MKILRLAIFCALALFSFICVPKAARAFDWPAGAAPAQRSQAAAQDAHNDKMLALSAKSKKPISAGAYLAVDLSNGKVLLQKKSDKAYPLASTTKLMNAVITLENIDAKKTITLTDKMLAPAGRSPSIFEGLVISVRDLLQASLIQSVNDAAESLAWGLGKEKFLGLMNQKAKDLVMAKTVYVDANGLDAKSRSTAADMAKLLAYIQKNHPEILATTKNNNFWLPNAQGELLKFANLNNFYDYPGFVGGKTGYSPAAKQTFAAIFNIKNKPVAIVLLHSSDYEADTFKILNQLKK
jgi:D-alanyl-D-alanine carboxypeptidase